MRAALCPVGTRLFDAILSNWRRHRRKLTAPVSLVVLSAALVTRHAWPVFQGLRWHLVQFGYVQYSTYNVTPSLPGGKEAFRRDLAVYGARDVEKVRNNFASLIHTPTLLLMLDLSRSRRPACFYRQTERDLWSMRSAWDVGPTAIFPLFCIYLVSAVFSFRYFSLLSNPLQAFTALPPHGCCRVAGRGAGVHAASNRCPSKARILARGLFHG